MATRAERKAAQTARLAVQQRAEISARWYGGISAEVEATDACREQAAFFICSACYTPSYTAAEAAFEIAGNYGEAIGAVVAAHATFLRRVARITALIEEGALWISRDNLAGTETAVGEVGGWREAHATGVAAIVRDYRLKKAVAQFGEVIGPVMATTARDFAGVSPVLVALHEAGVAVAAVESRRTEFVPWEVGGTYRHRAFVRCNPEAAKAALGESGDAMASQGGSVARRLFGCTSRARRGFRLTPEGVEVFQDQ